MGPWFEPSTSGYVIKCTTTMLLLLTSNICRPNHFVQFYLGSTVVKHSTHDPWAEGSNPTTGPGRQKMALKFCWISLTNETDNETEKNLSPQMLTRNNWFLSLKLKISRQAPSLSSFNVTKTSLLRHWLSKLECWHNDKQPSLLFVSKSKTLP
jgi:hypothetical protein